MIHLVHAQPSGMLLGHTDPYENVFMLRLVKMCHVKMRHVPSASISQLTAAVMNCKIQKIALGQQFDEVRIPMHRVQSIITVNQEFWTPYIDTPEAVLKQIETAPPDIEDQFALSDLNSTDDAATRAYQRQYMSVFGNRQERSANVAAVIRRAWTRDDRDRTFYVSARGMSMGALDIYIHAGAVYDSTNERLTVSDLQLSVLESQERVRGGLET